MQESEGERVLPTPETKAKLHPGTIEILINKNRLLPEHLRAAQEIEWVMRRVFGFLYAKNNMREPVDGGRSNTLSEKVAQVHQDNFKPWANWFKENKSDPVVSVVLDIVVEGQTATQLDKRHKRRKGWAVDTLIEGLDEYAKMAGWLN